MTFTIQDCETTCLLQGNKVALIIQVNSFTEPYDVSAQVPGEPNARVITWDKFERIEGIPVQTKGD